MHSISVTIFEQWVKVSILGTILELERQNLLLSFIHTICQSLMHFNETCIFLRAEIHNFPLPIDMQLICRGREVVRGVSGVSWDTPIFQNLLYEFQQKIVLKNLRINVGYPNIKILTSSLCRGSSINYVRSFSRILDPPQTLVRLLEYKIQKFY